MASINASQVTYSSIGKIIRVTNDKCHLDIVGILSAISEENAGWDGATGVAFHIGNSIVVIDYIAEDDYKVSIIE